MTCDDLITTMERLHEDGFSRANPYEGNDTKYISDLVLVLEEFPVLIKSLKLILEYIGFEHRLEFSSPSERLHVRDEILEHFTAREAEVPDDA